MNIKHKETMRNIDEDNRHIGSDTELAAEEKTSGRGKGVVLTLLGIVILVAFLYGASQLNKNNNSNTDVKLGDIKNLELEEQKRVLEAQLKEAEDKVKALAANADISDRYTAYIRLAELQNRLGMYQGAIESVDKVAAERQGNSRIYLTYATAYQGLGDKAKARDNIVKVMAMDDETPENWIKYFEIFDDLDPAMKDAKYTEALKKTNNNIELVKIYAKYLESQGNKEKAIIYWEVARNVDPANASTYEAEIQRLRQ
jgi:tetratricopeptide (TPR) repeat protein